MAFLKNRTNNAPAAPVVAPTPEPERLTVRLFPPVIEAVGAKPVSMVPWLLLLVVAVAVIFGPLIQGAARHGQTMVAGFYQHTVAPGEKPPDE